MPSKAAVCICGIKISSIREVISKIAFYRFLNNPKTNLLRFTIILSWKVTDDIEPLNRYDCANAFIMDDSFFMRTGFRKSELGSQGFDHTSINIAKDIHL